MMQSFARGLIGRQQFTSLCTTIKVLAIQRYVRGWLARRHYKRVIKGIILMQGHVRRRMAKRLLKQMKVRSSVIQLIFI